jgi:hypothetical protein
MHSRWRNQNSITQFTQHCVDPDADIRDQLGRPHKLNSGPRCGRCLASLAFEHRRRIMKIARRSPTITFRLMTVIVVCGVVVCRIGNAEEPRDLRLHDMLVINEDNSHFFGSRKQEDMNLNGLHAWVDQYAGSSVTHLFLCTTAMRASFRSKSRDAIWDPVDGKEPTDPWPQNAKRLHEAGLDPYKVWIARCRANKISPWLSMRMNDTHNTDVRDNFQHSSFWRKHPQFWRVPNSPGGSAMNYAHAEVREHHMAFVREMLDRYDPDGLELDWMRFPYHLTPGSEREERRILTEFVREVRSLTTDWSKKREHPILLGVRAPAHPDAAAGLGMDAVEWARNGLVDLIVPCPFYFSSDFDIPIELWHERLKDTAKAVAVVPGLESSARPWPGGEPVGNTLETLRGFAASSYHRGADGVYLFNWMDANDWPVSGSDYKLLLRDGVGAKVVASAARRHPVCFRDAIPAGFPSDVQLPSDARVGRTFRIHIGPNPDSGNVWAIAGLAKRDGLADARFQAKLNGQTLKAAEDLVGTKMIGGETARAIRFVCPLNAVKAGYNELNLRQIAGSAGQQIVWVEIRVDPSNQASRP